MKPVALKATLNCTECVCSSHWFGSASAKTTFTVAYVTSPLPVYPMTISTWSEQRAIDWFSQLSWRGLKTITIWTTLTFFTTLTQEPFCSLGAGHSDSGVTGIWNKNECSTELSIRFTLGVKYFYFNRTLYSTWWWLSKINTRGHTR